MKKLLLLLPLLYYSCTDEIVADIDSLKTENAEQDAQIDDLLEVIIQQQEYIDSLNTVQNTYTDSLHNAQQTTLESLANSALNAGFSYGSSELITMYTGKTPIENIQKITEVEEKNIHKKTLESDDFYFLVKQNIEKTNKILKLSSQ